MRGRKESKYSKANWDNASKQYKLLGEGNRFYKGGLRGKERTKYIERKGKEK